MQCTDRTTLDPFNLCLIALDKGLRVMWGVHVCWVFRHFCIIKCQVGYIRASKTSHFPDFHNYNLDVDMKTVYKSQTSNAVWGHMMTAELSVLSGPLVSKWQRKKRNKKQLFDSSVFDVGKVKRGAFAAGRKITRIISFSKKKPPRPGDPRISYSDPRQGQTPLHCHSLGL